MEKKWSVLLGLLVFVLLPTIQGVAFEKGDIKIGHVAGLTGPASVQRHYFDGRRDMIEYVNQRGGIRGHKIVDYWMDTKYQLPPEISAYKRFVQQGIVIFLSTTTGGSEQLKVIARGYKVPSFFIVNSVGARHPPGWHFPVYPTYGDCTAGAFDWILENMWKKSKPPKVAVICADTAYSRGPEEALPYLKSKGIELVYKAYVPMNAIDVTAQLTLAHKAGADFIINNPLMEIKALLRDLKRLGLDKKGMKVVCPWVTAIASIFPNICKEATGTIIGTWQGMVPDFEGKMGLGYIDQGWKDLVKSKYGKLRDTGMYWHMGPPEIAMIAEAIGKAIDKVGYDKLNGEAVYYQLERLELESEKMFNFMPDIKNVPGKRGMSDKAIIAVSNLNNDGLWGPVTGWYKMPNLLEWKREHPEYYK